MIVDNGMDHLWQWNTGQRLVLGEWEKQNGVTSASFTVDGFNAILRQVVSGYIDIPDILLQTSGSLVVYLHKGAADSLTTIAQLSFVIRTQPKPDDYVARFELLNWHNLDERLTRLENFGGNGSGGASDAVRYGAQKLTQEQQAQARENIAALAQSRLQTGIDDALAKAKQSGWFDGTDGGHYTPKVSQLDADHMQVDFIPSHSGMPAVETVRIALPKAPDDPLSDVCVALPESVILSSGKTLKVYKRNILADDRLRLWVGSSEGVQTKLYDDYLSISAGKSGAYPVAWAVCDGSRSVISGSIVINVPETGPAKQTNVIVIGDSTVADGAMTQKLLDLYQADSAKLTLLGSRGIAPNRHEGRGGWTLKDYCTRASSGASGEVLPNPFYNGKFDFSYYMTKQGYASVQSVVLQLGINDVFGFGISDGSSTEAIGLMDSMIDSIKAYSQDIKIIINLPTTPNSNGKGFTDAYGTSQIEWVYNKNIIRFSYDLIRHFKGRENVVISASNCVLDTKTQIRDGIHPTPEGYGILGERLYETLKNIAAPAEINLLNILGRERIKHSTVTVNPGDPHDLSETHCYDTQLTGIRSEYVTSQIISYRADSETGFTIAATGSSGNGIEFPVRQLVVGRRYRLSYTTSTKNVRCYLMQYNRNTTAFIKQDLLSTEKGSFVKEFTAAPDTIYSPMWAGVYSGADAVVCEITLTEI